MTISIFIFEKEVFVLYVFNKKVRLQRKKIPLWSQLLLLITLVTALLISFILVRDYKKNKDYVMEQQISTSNRLLDLEMQNLEQYIRDLTSFCLLPLYDSQFTQALNSRISFTPSQAKNIKELIQSGYFSRSDLEGYQIYFCNQNQTYGRVGSSQHVTLLQDSTLSQEEGTAISASGKYYNAIEPSLNRNCFFSFYQTLIRIQDRSQQAVVRIDVDTSYARSLNRKHLNHNEFICIFNRDTDLLYSGNTSVLPDAKTDSSKLLSALSDNESFLISLAGTDYLGVLCKSVPYGLTLLSLLPMDDLHQQLRSILRTNILTGVLLWFVVSVLIYILLRLSTRPLDRLSQQMVKAGDGNFSPLSGIGGSREISDLADSYNDMVRHIDRLIRQNYLSEINEKTSRLAALEAQLNPHFLYNTLQAIATEALVNDQPQIYDMITSLAANLRYSIKGGDLVFLQSEITYVKNYVLLQKTRLEDRLQVAFDVDESLLQAMIPKISIQILVENAILHGIGTETDSVTIAIQVLRHDKYLCAIVSDNGCGIPADQLQQMKASFQNFLHPDSAGKIGLANLNSRLHLLYEEDATLEIQSIESEGTRITMLIPVTAERT